MKKLALTNLVLAVSFTSPAQVAAPGFRVVDLGTLGGQGAHMAAAINRRGAVAGASTTPGLRYHACVHDGTLRDLGTLGGPASEAAAINDRGDVVGWAQTPSGATHAFLVVPGDDMIDLGTLGGEYSTAVAVNNAGQIAGVSSIVTGEWHGFLWENGHTTDLGALIPAGINDRGQVAGVKGLRAVLYNTVTAGVRELGFLPNTVLCRPAHISNSGRVVGSCTITYRQGLPFRWDNGVMASLPWVGQWNLPTGVNSRGWAVGNISFPLGVIRTYSPLWTKDRLYDLNDLISPVEKLTWNIPAAAAINDGGQIAAAAVYLPAGNTRIVRLDPIE